MSDLALVGFCCVLAFLIYNAVVTDLCYSYWQRTKTADHVPWYVNAFFWGDGNFQRVKREGRLREFVEMMHWRLRRY